MTDAKSIHELWRDNCVAMVMSGIDATEAADAMLA